MFERFVAWWVRNATYIGPVANCVSAIAALLTVWMVTKTFRQARKDRREELLAKHPRFKIVSAQLINESAANGRARNADEPITCRLELDLKNINPNPAYAIKVRGTIYLKDEGLISLFKVEPSDEVDKDELLSVEQICELRISQEPYYVMLTVGYRDSLTHESYSRSHTRMFYVTGGSPLQMSKLLKEDIRALSESISPRRKDPMDNSPLQIQ